MKLIVSLLLLLCLFLPIETSAQNSLDQFLRKRTDEFLIARTARKAAVMRTFFNPEDIKDIHDFLKYQYVSIKNDMAKGIFTKAYVERALEDSHFADPYKEGLTNYLFKNAEIDRELERAFARFLSEYKYTIKKYEIKKVEIEPDGSSATVSIVEYRVIPESKDPIPTPRELKWLLKDKNWFLATDKPANL